MKKIKLCVLFGGRSSEYEVSLKSAYSVLSNADREKYDILPVGITREGEWYFFEGDYESVPDGSWCADLTAMDRVGLDLASGRREFCRFSADVQRCRGIFQYHLFYSHTGNFTYSFLYFFHNGVKISLFYTIY